MGFCSKDTGIFIGGLVYLSISGTMIGLTIYSLISRQILKNSYDAVAVANTVVKNASLPQNTTSDSLGPIYCPIYYFFANGYNYSCESHYLSRFYVQNATKKVFYHSSNPKDCLTSWDLGDGSLQIGGILFLLIFIGIGIFLIILGLKLWKADSNNNYILGNNEINDSSNLATGLAANNFNDGNDPK